MKRTQKKRELHELKNEVDDKKRLLSTLSGGTAAGLRANLMIRKDLMIDEFITWKNCGKRNRTK